MSDTLLQTNQETLWLLLAYDGTAFHGSQEQRLLGSTFQASGSSSVFCPSHSKRPQLLTVAGLLRQAFEQLGFPLAEVSLHLASRTDAGVHAYGQVAQCRLPHSQLARIPDLRRALNARLLQLLAYHPRLQVLAVQRFAPAQRSCQKAACARWYRYRWFLNASPLHSPHGTVATKPLNVSAMQAAAKTFLGRQCFTSFKSPNTPVVDDWCTVIAAQVWSDERTNSVVFDVISDRYLYKMVRNMAAMLEKLGTGVLLPELPPEMAVQQVLAAQSRQASPWTAPAAGLALMAIDYPENLRFFSNHVYVKLLTTILTVEPTHHENLFRQAG